MTSTHGRAETKRGERLMREESLLGQSAAGTLLEDSLSKPLFLLDLYRSIKRERQRGGRVWPASAEALLQSLESNERLRAVLDLDGETLEELSAKAPEAIDAIRAALAIGRLELLGGSYYRSLNMAIGGESILRHLARGVATVRQALRVDAATCLVDERQVFPQLAQILRGFGFESAIAIAREDGDGRLRLSGPDGSKIPFALALVAGAPSRVGSSRRAQLEQRTAGGAPPRVRRKRTATALPRSCHRFLGWADSRANGGRGKR